MSVTKALQLSVHAIKSWQRCQRQFELTVLKDLRWPQNPKNFALGVAVHQLLDYEAKGLPLEAVLNAADPESQRVFSALQASDWAKAEILASEWPFSLALEGVWIHGRIDRIIKLSSDKYAILDWKTGTSTPEFPETDWQTRIYLLAVSRLYQSLGLTEFVPEQWSMVYVEVNRDDMSVCTASIPCSEAYLKETERELRQISLDIQSCEIFALPVACPDRYCSYLPVCGIQEKIHSI